MKHRWIFVISAPMIPWELRWLMLYIHRMTTTRCNTRSPTRYESVESDVSFGSSLESCPVVLDLRCKGLKDSLANVCGKMMIGALISASFSFDSRKKESAIRGDLSKQVGASWSHDPLVANRARQDCQRVNGLLSIIASMWCLQNLAKYIRNFQSNTSSYSAIDGHDHISSSSCVWLLLVHTMTNEIRTQFVGWLLCCCYAGDDWCSSVSILGTGSVQFMETCPSQLEQVVPSVVERRGMQNGRVGLVWSNGRLGWCSCWPVSCLWWRVQSTRQKCHSPLLRLQESLVVFFIMSGIASRYEIQVGICASTDDRRRCNWCMHETLERPTRWKTFTSVFMSLLLISTVWSLFQRSLFQRFLFQRFNNNFSLTPWSI